MTFVSQAQSGDAGFIHKIEQARFSGVVHSTFEKNINIRNLVNGELYTIAYIESDNAPNTVVTDLIILSGMDIAVDDMVYADHHALCIANKLCIRIEHAKKWHSRVPDFPDDEQILSDNLIVMKEYIELHGTGGGMKRPTRPLTAYEEEVSGMLNERSSRLLTELSGGLLSNALPHAIGLIGLGSGLTPSGDDFLVGLFTVMNMRNSPSNKYKSFFREILSKAQGLTNEISYMALKKASTGQVRESIIALIHALINGNRQQLVASLEAVLNIGSSSGTDIALGIIGGLQYIEENRR